MSARRDHLNSRILDMVHASATCSRRYSTSSIPRRFRRSDRYGCSPSNPVPVASSLARMRLKTAYMSSSVSGDQPFPSARETVPHDDSPRNPIAFGSEVTAFVSIIRIVPVTQPRIDQHALTRLQAVDVPARCGNRSGDVRALDARKLQFAAIPGHRLRSGA